MPGNSSWHGPSLPEAWYRRPLLPDELEDLDQAVRRATDEGKSAEDISRPEDFPLPLLGTALDQVGSELEGGLGFSLLKDVPVHRYDAEQHKLILMGLLVHLGRPMHQDTEGTLVEVVTDRGLSYEDPTVRGYMTSAELTPHCDSGDIVGLLCVRQALRGGASRICSGVSIHEELLATSPELLEPLYRGFHHNIRGNGPPGAEDVTRQRVPVFCLRDGRVSIRYNFKAIMTAERLPGVPSLSVVERRAIERVAELAVRPDLSFEMMLHPGDLQLLNNHAILHTRSHYEDSPDPCARRLLLRAWVNVPSGRLLDDTFTDHFNTGPRQPPALKQRA